MLNSLQTTTIEYFGYGRGSPINHHRLAAKAFDNAFVRGKWAAFLARLSGKSLNLKVLARQPESSARRTLGVVEVHLDQIVGSLSRSQDFDAEFRPLQDYDRERWINVASAIFSGVILPAVELVRAEDGYYVCDGHHRISVARALGQFVIEARVVN